MNEDDAKYFTPQQLRDGIAANNARAMNATKKQLKILYEEAVITADSTRVSFRLPKAAISFLLKYVLISLPNDEAVLNDVFITASDEADGINYIFNENKFEKVVLGAKVNLFTTPGGSPDPANIQQGQYLGMTPIFIRFKGEQQLVFDIRGNLTTYAESDTVNIMLYGEQENKLNDMGNF